MESSEESSLVPMATNRLKGLARGIREEAAVYRSVMSDSRCPRVSRWLLGSAVVYALSPVDLIPDFIPLLGHLDDLVIVPLLVWLALRAIPEELVLEYRIGRTDRTGNQPSSKAV
jgi:uncharacterized membrane protein YkvA (DUF1232 family)